MSAMVTIRLKADPEKFQTTMVELKDKYEEVMTESKSAGAIHHRFAVGDGEVFVVDEWKDAASFQKFFEANTTIPQIMQAAGVQGPPEVTIAEFVGSPDEF